MKQPKMSEDEDDAFIYEELAKDNNFEESLLDLNRDKIQILETCKLNVYVPKIEYVSL